MDVFKWLEIVAEIKDSENGYPTYRSKYDGSYITHVGMEDRVVHLADREITGELTHGVGFSPKDGNWYGWSHRAIYGFSIGSTCEKGDLCYQPSNKEDFRQDWEDFWRDEDSQTKIWSEFGVHRIRYVDYEDDPDSYCEALREVEGSETYGETFGEEQQGVWVHFTYNDTIPNKSLHGVTTSHFRAFPKKFGRGEWVAKTLEDAKQMAIDFNEEVS